MTHSITEFSTMNIPECVALRMIALTEKYRKISPNLTYNFFLQSLSAEVEMYHLKDDLQKLIDADPALLGSWWKIEVL